MLSLLGRVGTDVSNDKILEIYQKHLQQVEDWMKKQYNIDYIQMSYNDVINNPIKNAKLVCQFLGGRLDKDKMSQIIEKSLYRIKMRKNIGDTKNKNAKDASAESRISP